MTACLQLDRSRPRRVGPGWLALSVALGLAVQARPATSQGVAVGGQVSWGDDMDLAGGPRVVLDLDALDRRLRIIGAFDLFFPNDFELDERGVTVPAQVDYWELTFLLAYSVETRPFPLAPYFGAGYTFVRQSVDGSPDGQFDGTHTDGSVSLMAGTEVGRGPARPFLELRYVPRASLTDFVRGGQEWVVSGGLVVRI